MAMRIDVMTLFPEVCAAYTDSSILGRAQQKGLVEFCYHNIRDYSGDKHNRVDDYSYGGGPGMIMRPEPVYACFEAICAERGSRPKLFFMSPQGKPFIQDKAIELSKLDGFVILCGHYEGIDQRVIDLLVDEEISIGDYVLTGGEPAAMVVSDAVVRLLDGVLSQPDCYLGESHMGGLLEYPQYTRPDNWRGMAVPEVLVSGHHENIENWRKQKSVEITRQKRPDLLREDNPDIGK